MKDFGIFGTSGMARETGDIVAALGYRPIYIARDQAELETWSFPEEVVTESQVERYRSMPFAIGIGENLVRQKVARRFAGKLRFATIAHPSATFGIRQLEVMEASQGVIVCAGVRFTNNIKVGDFSIFNQNACIAHDVIVEEFAMVSPGACISGNVHLGTRCWIGAGAVINQGNPQSRLHIGNDTIIGSGSIVLSTCAPNAVYVGNPAKRIK